MSSLFPCDGCGREVDAAGVFPGGRVACAACGAESVVGAVGVPVYRAPAPRISGPEPVARAAPSRACPRCRHALAHAVEHEESVERCDECGGVFVALLSLASMVGAAHGRATPDAPWTRPPLRPTADGYLPCPTCRELMNRLPFGLSSGVLIDICRPHGVWFDRGELDAAMSFVLAGRLEAGLVDGAGVVKAQPRDTRTDLERQLALETVLDANRAESTAASTAALIRDHFLPGLRLLLRMLF